MSDQPDIDPRVVLSPAAFDELVADLERPVRPSKLSELIAASSDAVAQAD